MIPGDDQLARLREAFRSKAPAAEMKEIARSLRDKGHTQLEVYCLFDKLFTVVSADEQDVMDEAMEIIWGGPWAKGRGLYPTELNDSEFKLFKKQHGLLDE